MLPEIVSGDNTFPGLSIVAWFLFPSGCGKELPQANWLVVLGNKEAAEQTGRGQSDVVSFNYPMKYGYHCMARRLVRACLER